MMPPPLIYISNVEIRFKDRGDGERRACRSRHATVLLTFQDLPRVT